MSPRKTILTLLLALFIPSALLVSLQNDSTDRDGAGPLILFGYYDGSGPREVVREAGMPVMHARCLVRGVLDLCEWLGGDRLSEYNSVLQLLSAWAALCMVYLAAARLLPPTHAWAAVLLAVVFVPWGFLSVGYSTSWPYDFPSFFFAACGTWTILSRRFGLFAATIVLGTLNKETIVFLLPAYLLAEWPLLPRKTWVTRALILASLFLVTYETPRMIFAANHRPALTFSASDEGVPRWKMNLHDFMMSERSTLFENPYWALSIHLLPLLGLLRLPWPLRAIYCAVPVLLVPIFFWGNTYELRLYNEIIPLGAIGTVLLVSRWLETSASPSLAPVPADDAARPVASTPGVAARMTLP